MVASVIETRAKKIFKNFDIDHDGAITKDDFEVMAKRLTDALGIKSSSGQGRGVADSYAKVWEELQRQADTDRDGRVTAAEYAAVFGTRDFVKVLDLASDAEFKAADTDGDDVLSQQELRNMLEAYGVPSSEIGNAVQALDQDGDGRVSRQEYREAWHSYYTDTNTDTPISMALGRI
ncbi:EF-hand domain-containing protein [Streptomyces sp. BR123]|uniref:EF-hand domain-containing protein n=1 Tax=Streptomyces sp. BR123 TaxID=2749828 RepID=UPI0015C4D469|nr:EF-hand domain-containing protein [Streptomyces sp. BR123]NXY93595.1 EF-hand domain-containing protein [Streptomyces sp. BR123]